jgi:hypothetical protein
MTNKNNRESGEDYRVSEQLENVQYPRQKYPTGGRFEELAPSSIKLGSPKQV